MRMRVFEQDGMRIEYAFIEEYNREEERPKDKQRFVLGCKEKDGSTSFVRAGYFSSREHFEILLADWNRCSSSCRYVELTDH